MYASDMQLIFDSKSCKQHEKQRLINTTKKINQLHSQKIFAEIAAIYCVELSPSERYISSTLSDLLLLSVFIISVMESWARQVRCALRTFISP